jgi:hypothetical protein
MKGHDFKNLQNDFLKDFKKWVNSEHDNNLITVNSFVRPNTDYKSITENIDCPMQDHTSKEIIKCFMKNGGRVKEVNENVCLVQTKKGKFYIAKNFLD